MKITTDFVDCSWWEYQKNIDLSADVRTTCVWDFSIHFELPAAVSNSVALH